MQEKKLQPKVKKYIYLLMLGHIVTDINQGALPAVLPFLVSQHGLSFAAAGGLMLALTSVSSVIQPFLGHFSDKLGNPQVMSIGVLIAGSGFAALGVVNSYPAMFLCVLVSGIGIALFHPEGGRMVNCVAKTGKGEAMGTFSLGGSIGFTVGPLLVILVIPLLGLRGLLFFLVPPIVTVLLLQYCKKDLKSFSDREYEERSCGTAGGKQDNWKGFSILSAVILSNSIVDYGLITFIPLFWLNILNQSEGVGSFMLAVMTALGAIATYMGGRMADRFGFRKIIILGSLLYVPIILMAGLSTNMVLSAIAVVLLGLTVNLSHSPSVALGQSYLPNHVGLASGITLGLAVSFGGLASPVLGWIGDRNGLVMVMLTLAVVGGVSAFFSLLIPKANKKNSV